MLFRVTRNNKTDTKISYGNNRIYQLTLIYSVVYKIYGASNQYVLRHIIKYNFFQFTTKYKWYLLQNVS